MWLYKFFGMGVDFYLWSWTFGWMKVLLDHMCDVYLFHLTFFYHLYGICQVAGVWKIAVDFAIRIGDLDWGRWTCMLHWLWNIYLPFSSVVSFDAWSCAIYNCDALQNRMLPNFFCVLSLPEIHSDASSSSSFYSGISGKRHCCALTASRLKWWVSRLTWFKMKSVFVTTKPSTILHSFQPFILLNVDYRQRLLGTNGTWLWNPWDSWSGDGRGIVFFLLSKYNVSRVIISRWRHVNTMIRLTPIVHDSFQRGVPAAWRQPGKQRTARPTRTNAKPQSVRQPTMHLLPRFFNATFDPSLRKLPCVPICRLSIQKKYFRLFFWSSATHNCLPSIFSPHPTPPLFLFASPAQETKAKRRLPAKGTTYIRDAEGTNEKLHPDSIESLVWNVRDRFARFFS